MYEGYGLFCQKCNALNKPEAMFCKRCGSDSDMVHTSMEMYLCQARNFEIARRFEEAAEIYEYFEMWEDAGRVRKIAKQPKTVQHQYIAGHIDMSTKAEITDSVIHKSSIGGSSQKPFSICPYCSEELNLPKTPMFCPYCREQLQE